MKRHYYCKIPGCTSLGERIGLRGKRAEACKRHREQWGAFLSGWLAAGGRYSVGDPGEGKRNSSRVYKLWLASEIEAKRNLAALAEGFVEAFRRAALATGVTLALGMGQWEDKDNATGLCGHSDSLSRKLP